MRIVLGISLALLAASVDAGRYSHEREQANQEVCRKGGDLAVAARTHPDVARDQIAQYERRGKADRHHIGRAWSDAMRTGLQASPDIADRDLYMRGWAACMDVMDP